MKLKNLLTALTIFSGASVAQAAEFRLGLQANGITLLGQALAAEAGVNFSVQWPLGTGGLQLRQVVEGGAIIAPGSTGVDILPLLRFGTDLIKYGGALYYGGGLGSGVFIPTGRAAPGPSTPDESLGILLSPLLLANVHAIIGKDFGGYSVEGIVRLGAVSSLGVRASFPLR
jgi:hypothetical protein